VNSAHVRHTLTRQLRACRHASESTIDQHHRLMIDRHRTGVDFVKVQDQVDRAVERSDGDLERGILARDLQVNVHSIARTHVHTCNRWTLKNCCVVMR
jgi:hypothetical protein